MNFDLTMEDYTIILNALHYYKKVEKIGNFQQLLPFHYVQKDWMTEKRIQQLEKDYVR